MPSATKARRSLPLVDLRTVMHPSELADLDLMGPVYLDPIEPELSDAEEKAIGDALSLAPHCDPLEMLDAKAEALARAEVDLGREALKQLVSIPVETLPAPLARLVRAVNALDARQESLTVQLEQLAEIADVERLERDWREESYGAAVLGMVGA